jgi:hypothetical protein
MKVSFACWLVSRVILVGRRSGQTVARPQSKLSYLSTLQSTAGNRLMGIRDRACHGRLQRAAEKPPSTVGTGIVTHGNSMA